MSRVPRTILGLKIMVLAESIEFTFRGLYVSTADFLIMLPKFNQFKEAMLMYSL